jgi:hypothetical protein
VGSKLVNGSIFMALLRKPSYRMALLKYINLVRKKKPRADKQLSTIMSEGAYEDMHSEMPGMTKRSFSPQHATDDSPEGKVSGQSTIKQLIETKPLVAGRLLDYQKIRFMIK